MLSLSLHLHHGPATSFRRYQVPRFTQRRDLVAVRGHSESGMVRVPHECGRQLRKTWFLPPVDTTLTHLCHFGNRKTKFPAPSTTVLALRKNRNRPEIWFSGFRNLQQQHQHKLSQHHRLSFLQHRRHSQVSRSAFDRRLSLVACFVSDAHTLMDTSDTTQQLDG